MTSETGTLTERALMKRINRKLAHHGCRLDKFRPGTPYARERYFIADDRNHIIGGGNDLQAIAQDLGQIVAEIEAAS